MTGDYLLFWAITSIFLLQNVEGGMSFLSFHDDSLPTSTTWAIWDPANAGTFPETENLTICYWAKFTAIKTANAVINYADYIYIYHSDMGMIPVYFADEDLVFKCDTAFLQWTSYCFTFNGQLQRASLYVNGSLCMSVPYDDNNTIPGGGSVVLGHDELGEEMSFEGDMADLRIWAVAFTEEEVLNAAKCNYGSEKPFVIFRNNAWLLNGTAAWIKTETADNICKLAESQHVNIIFFNGDRKQGEQFCHSLGGKLPVPKNQKEDTRLKEAVARFREFSWDAHNFLLGIIKENGTWKNRYTKEELTFTKWPPKEAMVGKIPTSLAYNIDKDFWFGFMPSIPITVPCEVPLTKYTIRGMCRESLLDNQLWLYQTHKGKMKFRSIRGTDLSLEDDTWVLQKRLNDEHTSAELESRRNPFPIGLNKWMFYDDTCSDEDKEKPLIITRCSSDQFSCRDFKCIPISKLCDQKGDCEDGSDETDCGDRAFFPFGYQSGPPAFVDMPFDVQCIISIINFRSIDIKEMLIKVDLLLTIRWKDVRVFYKNLRKVTEENTVPLDMKPPIWTPKIRMMSSLGAEATMTINKREMMLELDGRPLKDNLAIPQESVTYSSEAVTHRLKVKAYAEYTFHPNLRKFPFDTQTCRLLIELDVGSTATLHVGKVRTVNPPYRNRLLEYKVTDMSVELQNSTLSSGQDIVLIAEFEHLFTYYILSIYMPTMLLMVISYITFFFDYYNFSDRIMAALTSLLVLATFLSATSSSMARVSYFTLIDIWLAFCIVIVFGICLIHTCAHFFLLKPSEGRNHVKTQQVAPLKSNKPLGFTPYASVDTKLFRWFVYSQIFSKVFFPIVIIVFCLCYLAMSYDED